MTTEAQNVGDEFSALCHGLASGSYPDTYRAYKQLYQIGRPVIPYITEYLNEMEFSDLKRPVEFRFLNGLLSLLNDIDETKANEVGGTYDIQSERLFSTKLLEFNSFASKIFSGPTSNWEQSSRVNEEMVLTRCSTAGL